MLLLPNDNTVSRILFQSHFLPLVTATTDENYATKNPQVHGRTWTQQMQRHDIEVCYQNMQ